jgi:hypothetical protein
MMQMRGSHLDIIAADDQQGRHCFEINLSNAPLLRPFG